MRTQVVTGGWHSDALPGGQFVTLVTGSHVQTDRGPVAFESPPREPLYLRLSDDGSRFAAQSHWVSDTVEYTGAAWRVIPQQAVGVSPVIYDADGVLRISDGSIGSQGWRYVAVDGRLVTGDATYAPGPGFTLYEWTDLSRDGDTLIVGQGAEDGVHLWDGTSYRVVVTGNCRFVRAHRVGADVSIATYRILGGTTTEAVLTWATVAEFLALPIMVSPVPAIRVPQGSPSWVGSFFMTAGSPGNAAIWVTRNGVPMRMPDQTGIVAEIELADLTPAGRLLGLWTTATPTVSLQDRITLARPIAERLRVPMFVYSDTRDYPLEDIARWCGTTPWVALPQCYISSNQEPLAAFRRSIDSELATLTGRQVFPVVRAHTGSGFIAVPHVAGAINEMATLVGTVAGWFLFAWDRADVPPELQAFVRAWLEVPVPSGPVREWTESFYPRRPPVQLPADVWARIQRFAQGYPPPQGTPGDEHDERCRVWTRCVSEQIRAQFGAAWGTKRASADRPPSKETIARTGAGTLDGWDLLSGASTGRPVLSSDPEWHDLVAEGNQVFIPVTPVDRLGRSSSRPTIPTPWIGVTAFDLGPRLASGDRRFLDYLKQGFTVARVIIASNYRMPRTLEEGRAQLPEVLSSLRGIGVKAEIVLLVDTGDNNYSQATMLDHVAKCNAIMLTYPDVIALVEIANEIGHGSQSPKLFDIDFLDQISAKVDMRFPLAWGGEFEGGNIVTLHSDRGNTPEANGVILGDRQTACGKPIIDDEPMGIAEVGRTAGRQRVDDPDYARRLAVACKDHNLAGTTHHGDVGLFTTVDAPYYGPVQQEAARLFLKELVEVPPAPGHPILDADMTNDAVWYPIFVGQGPSVDQVTKDWYVKATGREPAYSDIRHGEFWRGTAERMRWKTLRTALENTWPGGAP